LAQQTLSAQSPPLPPASWHAGPPAPPQQPHGAALATTAALHQPLLPALSTWQPPTAAATASAEQWARLRLSLRRRFDEWLDATDAHVAACAAAGLPAVLDAAHAAHADIATWDSAGRTRKACITQPAIAPPRPALQRSPSSELCSLSTGTSSTSWRAASLLTIAPLSLFVPPPAPAVAASQHAAVTMMCELQASARSLAGSLAGDAGQLAGLSGEQATEILRATAERVRQATLAAHPFLAGRQQAAAAGSGVPKPAETRRNRGPEYDVSAQAQQLSEVARRINSASLPCE